MGRRFLPSPETYRRLAVAIQQKAYNENVILSLLGGDRSSFHRYTAELDDMDRARVFFALPLSVQEACRAEVLSDARCRHRVDSEVPV